MHSGSCNHKALLQLIAGTKSVSKLYFIVHLIPLLLKYKKVAHKYIPTYQALAQNYSNSS
jgi:hypothetical protein